MSETNTKLLQETSKTYKDEMTYRFQKRPLSRIVFYYLDFNYNVDFTFTATTEVSKNDY